MNVHAPEITQAERNNDHFLTGRSCRDREWWCQEARQQGSDWNAVTSLALDIIRSHCFESSFMRACREDDERRKPSAPRKPVPRPTPQSTIDAVAYCVQVRGIDALREPANQQRLRTFDTAARDQLNRRIAKLLPENQTVAI
jgi:hypothetical protein